jgi:hypothetical protein
MEAKVSDSEDLEPLAAEPPAAWSAPEPVVPEPVESGPPGSIRRSAIVGLIVAMLVAGGIGYGLTAHLESGKSFSEAINGPSASSTPGGNGGNASPGSTAPPSSDNDKDAGALSGVVVQSKDVTAGYEVALIQNGDKVGGTTTLDLCNGTYASESLRTARLQVAETDPTGNLVMSTEAVLYHDAKDANEAFGELRSVTARCPKQPVVSPVGEQTVTTTFQAPPDRDWHTADGVDRLAYALTTVDTQGQQEQSIAVYLRRGRALLGVYFSDPSGAQPAVDGKTTIPAIVTLFSQRLAGLPSSVTGS